MHKYPGFSLKQLRYRCRAPISEIFRELQMMGGKIYGKPGEQHGYLDRGSKVLAVSHLDYVCSGGLLGFDAASIKGDTYVFSQSLDDRLGVYTILDFLPFMGTNVDILFTENEESGATTAADFLADKDYNWIVEFDRKGTDVVTYCYDWPKDLLEKHFYKGHGSFSDICELAHLACQGMNIGIGYHDEHTKYCFCVIEEWFSQMKRFLAFFDEHKDIHYPYERAYSNYAFGGYGYWNNYGTTTKRDLVKTKGGKHSYLPILHTKDYTDDILEPKKKESESAEEARQSESFDSLVCFFCLDYDKPGWILEMDEEQSDLVWVPCPDCNDEEDWDREETDEETVEQATFFYEKDEDENIGDEEINQETLDAIDSIAQIKREIDKDVDHDAWNY